MLEYTRLGKEKSINDYLDIFIRNTSFGKTDVICRDIKDEEYNFVNERVGKVIKVGEEVTKFKVGEFVILPGISFEDIKSTLRSKESYSLFSTPIALSFEIHNDYRTIHYYYIDCSDFNVVDKSNLTGDSKEIEDKYIYMMFEENVYDYDLNFSYDYKTDKVCEHIFN